MNEDASQAAKCPQCGIPVETDAPEGLCPRCLITLNLVTETNVEGSESDGPDSARPSPASPPAPSDIAWHFPQLEILECLGRGGMGVVYKARQPKLNRLVALKILAPERESEPKFAERFEREAQALARLSHPNIVAVHDFGETDGLFFLLMEFVDGANLRQVLQGRKIEPEEALAIVPKICEALQYAHGKGIVHRDIKPENVLLDREGQVKIADFGIAKILRLEEAQPTITEEGAVGTPHYMAPEQVEHPTKVDHRADIYSLGVVFYEMLTGELPLGKFAPPSRKVHVDVRLDEVVLHALEKEPARRYQQASQVKTDVETIVADPTTKKRADRADGQASTASGPLTATATATTRNTTRGLLWALLAGGAAGAFVGLDLDLKYVWGIGSTCVVLGAIRLTQVPGERRDPGRVASWKAFVFLVAAISFLFGAMLAGFKATENTGAHSYILIAALNLGAAIGFGIFGLANFLSRQPAGREATGVPGSGPPGAASAGVVGGSPPYRGRVWPWVFGCLGGGMLIGLLVIVLLGSVFVLTQVYTQQEAQEAARRDGLVAQTVALAATHEESVRVSEFGPIIESTITPPETLGTNQIGRWLDLDDGELARVPTGLVEFDPASLAAEASTAKDAKSIMARHESRVIDWMDSHGVDLACGDKRGRLGMFTPRRHPLRMVPVRDELWDSADPNQVLEELDNDQANAWDETEEDAFFVFPLTEEPSFPLTFAFQTHAGTAGLLQATDFASEGPGLQTRFKQILGETDPVRPARQASIPVRVPELTERPKVVFEGGLLIVLLCVLGLAISAAVGVGAIWWVSAGTRTGSAMGRAALVLAIAGLPTTVVSALILRQVGVDTATLFLPIFLAFEIPAFALGLISRQTGLGKAAMITSGTLMVLSLLLLA